MLQDLLKEIMTPLTDLRMKVENGEIDEVTCYVALKNFEKEFDKIKEVSYIEASSKFSAMNKHEMENLPFGAKCQERGRTTYEYSQNAKYVESNTEAKRLEKLIKIATDNNSAIADPDTGEMIYAVPCKYSSTYAVTI